MRVLIFVLLLFVFVPVANAAEEYICPMHPHISGEQSDTCPVCGMTLVPKTASAPSDPDGHNGMSATDKPEGAIHIMPRYVQALGVKTSKARHHEFGREIRAFGRIVPSTRLTSRVDIRTSGWIVDLKTNAVGDEVEKGDLLFTFYSPDLMNAQSDFLIAGGEGRHRQRLRLYGMGEKAIAELKEKGRYMDQTPFYAPRGGTIVALNVEDGAYLKEGGSVLSLQDFSNVWVEADVPLKDAQFLEEGTPATITLPETGESYQTTTDFIHPVTDPQSRTATVRLVVDNKDGKLKPERYVEAVFEAQARHRLAVPAQAVLYGKNGARVIEALGDGYFRPVMVETGITSKGWTEITSGLSHGQNIVKTGQFMLDAESNLTGGMGNMGAMGHDHGGHKDSKDDTDENGMDMNMNMEGHNHE